jgi:FAD synthetase
MHWIDTRTTSRKPIYRPHKLTSYSLSELSLSYNGGKDCLVLLILYLAALHAHPKLPSTIQSVYIVSAHPFPEVETFVSSSSSVCSLSLSRYATSMKTAFGDYLSDFPSVKAIFVGTRRTDPHGAALTHFDRTDHGWPDFMRVHPVIDWHYIDIWTASLHHTPPFHNQLTAG